MPKMILQSKYKLIEKLSANWAKLIKYLAILKRLLGWTRKPYFFALTCLVAEISYNHIGFL